MGGGGVCVCGGGGGGIETAAYLDDNGTFNFSANPRIWE